MPFCFCLGIAFVPPCDLPSARSRGRRSSLTLSPDASTLAVNTSRRAGPGDAGGRSVRPGGLQGGPQRGRRLRGRFWSAFSEHPGRPGVTLRVRGGGSLAAVRCGGSRGVWSTGTHLPAAPFLQVPRSPLPQTLVGVSCPALVCGSASVKAQGSHSAVEPRLAWRLPFLTLTTGLPSFPPLWEIRHLCTPPAKSRTNRTRG